jgi:HK97 family phage major capsid protein
MPSLLEAKESVKTLSLKALEVVESTTMTPSEQKDALDKIEEDLEKAQKDVANLTHVEEKRAKFMAASNGDLAAAAEAEGRQVLKSLGEQFVESDGYKALCKRGFGGEWSSGQVELKTTLTEGTVASPGPGFAPIATPVVLPGVVDIRFQPLVIADLIPQGATTSTLIRYLVETVVTNAAAATAEGAAYGESALTFDKVDETLKKITTILPTSDEMLEDWLQTQSYINARLQLFINLKEQSQLLSGSGSGANILGLLNRTGLATAIPKAGDGGSIPASDNSMDAIYRQITQLRITSYMEPDATVIDPIAWQNILLAKNTQGFYYANGPFVSEADSMLWGKRVVHTPAISANTALVGAFAQAAQIFRKGGVTVEASNSHNDNFSKGIVSIRAEKRLSLAVYRPGAFGTVTGL